MSKIIIKETKKDTYVKAKMCPEKFIHLLAMALTQAVKEFNAVEDKKDFQRIMGLYYDTEE